MHMTTPTPHRLADEGGFTLAVAMGIMLIASIVCLAAFQAANGDLVASGDNSDRKTAYAAAESGIAWYQAKLNADPNYWQQCDTGTTERRRRPGQPEERRRRRAQVAQGRPGTGTPDGRLLAGDPAGRAGDHVLDDRTRAR